MKSNFFAPVCHFLIFFQPFDYFFVAHSLSFSFCNFYLPFRRGEEKLGAAAAGREGASGPIAKRAANKLN